MTIIKNQPAKSTIAAIDYNKDFRQAENNLFIALVACLILILAMSNAYAQTPSPMGTVLCNIAAIVYGNLGRGIATLAVVVIGVGATLGKTSWGLAMTVAVGIAVIFNAGGIVTLLTNGAYLGC